MQLILEVSSASSIQDEVASCRQVLSVSSLETTTIVNNKALVFRRDVFLVDTCFTTGGIGDILHRVINTGPGVDQ